MRRLHQPQGNLDPTQNHGGRLPRQELRSVLLVVHHTHPIHKLRHQTTITQVVGRDLTGSSQLQRDDALYRERGQSEDDDELTPG